ncbi:hypothetical protein QFC22_006390 [Naganishia vaughanmartiniae]|uniref:Uncharacterized protein n=1 Tax=Naganishia vaughanmartiniae TaxID=1424756 RepID=A0ACC2WK22_9TREE|nr:hypothetical protein QFC22_006390 [Naganishia vaughanmartiniae]
MQADSASTIDDSIRKEKRAQDVDDIDATVRGASPTGVKDIEDAVFGAIGEDGPNYRNLGWTGACIVMIKVQVGLGVLSLPATLHTLGLVPGVLLMLLICAMNTWSDWVVGAFKRRHPEVYSVADVGYMFGGVIGREVLGAIYWIFMVAVVGSSLLSISIALNAMSMHATCTAVFVAVALVITFIFASIQTLDKIAWLTWSAVFGLVAALLVVTIGVGIQDRPADAPATGPWEKDLQIFGKPTFLAAMSAVAQLVTAFAGAPAFFSIAAEMRDVRLFTRSLYCAQTFMLSLYLAIGITVYYYTGQYVASPALGSAGVLLKRVAYGVALPALIVTAVIYAHLPAKWMFLRALHGTADLTKNTVKHWVYWLGSVFIVVIAAYIIASAVPVFSGLLGVIGASFCTALCLILPSFMWFYDKWAERRTNKSWSYRLVFAWNVFQIIAGTFIMVAGTWGSVIEIRDAYHANGGQKPFGCDDNSNSVPSS